MSTKPLTTRPTPRPQPPDRERGQLLSEADLLNQQVRQALSDVRTLVERLMPILRGPDPEKKGDDWPRTGVSLLDELTETKYVAALISDEAVNAMKRLTL